MSEEKPQKTQNVAEVTVPFLCFSAPSAAKKVGSWPQKAQNIAEVIVPFLRFSAISAAKKVGSWPQKAQKAAEKGDGYNLMEMLREVPS